jgi:hypothetical protein
MDFIDGQTHTGGGAGAGSHMPPPFELDFDKFDMLSEFPELDHYNTSGAMMHHGGGAAGSGPLLSMAATPVVPPSGGATKRHHISDYSPDWAWSEVSYRSFIF